jgi:hypothetical protein
VNDRPGSTTLVGMLEKSSEGQFHQKLNEEYRRRTAVGIIPGIMVVSATWAIFFYNIVSLFWKIAGLLILAALIARVVMDKVIFRDNAPNDLYFRIVKVISVRRYGSRKHFFITLRAGNLELARRKI